MTATDIVLAGAVASGVGGLWMWIREDGLIRTAAAFVAIFHPKPVRRRDARRVLGNAYMRDRPPRPARGARPRRLPDPRRVRRDDPAPSAESGGPSE